MQRSLKKLDIKYQEVLSLRFYEKKSHKEISEILDKKEGTIKSLLSRGLEKLKIKFKHNMKSVAIIATSVGGSYFIWHNRKAISNVFNNIIRNLRNSNSIDSDQMLKDIREARLKRFQ